MKDNFGSRLRMLRKSKNITLEQLADKFHLNKSSISRYERGEQSPAIDTVKELAEYFNVSVAFLMEGDNGQSDTSESEKNIEDLKKEIISSLNELDYDDLEFVLSIAERFSSLKKDK